MRRSHLEIWDRHRSIVSHPIDLYALTSGLRVVDAAAAAAVADDDDDDARLHTRAHERTHARTHARTRTHTHARTHARTHTHTHTKGTSPILVAMEGEDGRR